MVIDGPITIQVMLGLTLPSISEEELKSIEDAAPPGSTIRVVHGVRQAIEEAEDVDVILGFIPEARCLMLRLSFAGCMPLHRVWMPCSTQRCETPM